MKITTWSSLTSILVIALLAPGCATLMQGSTQQITVGSTPSGATVVVDGFQRLKTPTVIELSRKESHRLDISLEGYYTEIVDIRQVTSNMAAGNIVAGGLIGYAVDHSTGAAFRLVPEVVQVSLRPTTPEPPKVPVAADTNELEPVTNPK